MIGIITNHFTVKMKTPSIGLLNSLGFQNAQQKVLYAAHLLKIATVSSPAAIISPVIPGIPARPEVIAAPAYPARAASAAIASNPTALAFGALFKYSPAYAVGASIPAFPAKPATIAVAGSPAVPAQPAVPAVTSLPINALKGWEDAISIAKAVDTIQIIAYLPYASGAALIGGSTSGIDSILEMSQPSLQPTMWLDAKASSVPEAVSSEPPSLEKYLYKYALELVSEADSTSTIENVVKMVNNVAVACKKITLNLAATSYTLGSEALQLGKL